MSYYKNLEDLFNISNLVQIRANIITKMKTHTLVLSLHLRVKRSSNEKIYGFIEKSTALFYVFFFSQLLALYKWTTI